MTLKQGQGKIDNYLKMYSTVESTIKPNLNQIGLSISESMPALKFFNTVSNTAGSPLNNNNDTTTTATTTTTTTTTTNRISRAPFYVKYAQLS